MTIAIWARRWLLVVSVLLLIPSAAICFQNDTELESFHDRSLAGWPAGGTFLSDPSKYFSAIKAFLADRAFPIIQATQLRNNILFFVLDTVPQRRITLGGDKLIFINGTDEENLYDIFDQVCLQTQDPSNLAALQSALQGLADISKARKLPIDVILVPTLESLYGDRLPRSVPAKFRMACGARAAGHSALLDIAPPPPVHYLYPFAQMLSARNDPAFFPKGNWHPDGLSLKVVRDAYLHELGNTATVRDVAEMTTAPAELLIGYGIFYPLPLYRIVNPWVVEDVAMNAKLNALVVDLFENPVVATQVYSNAHAVDPETVLVLSDSFGDFAAKVLAGGFKRLFQITTNGMRRHTIAQALDRVARLGSIDRLVLLINESNFERIINASSDLRDPASFAPPK